MRLDERLPKREILATLLFERLDDVTSFLQARRLADLVLDRIESEKTCDPA